MESYIYYIFRSAFVTRRLVEQIYILFHDIEGAKFVRFLNNVCFFTRNNLTGKNIFFELRPPSSFTYLYFLCYSFLRYRYLLKRLPVVNNRSTLNQAVQYVFRWSRRIELCHEKYVIKRMTALISSILSPSFIFFASSSLFI